MKTCLGEILPLIDVTAPPQDVGSRGKQLTPSRSCGLPSVSRPSRVFSRTRVTSRDIPSGSTIYNIGWVSEHPPGSTVCYLDRIYVVSRAAEDFHHRQESRQLLITPPPLPHTSTPSRYGWRIDTCMQPDSPCYGI